MFNLVQNSVVVLIFCRIMLFSVECLSITKEVNNYYNSSEFEVPSLNFPGQMHRWRLSQFLQKGSERTRDSLLGDLAMSARFLVISAKGRLFGHFFSVAHAVHALLQGLIKLVDMVIGRSTIDSIDST